MSSMLDQQKLFVSDHTIYWPSRYEGVVEFLKGDTSINQKKNILFPLNVHAIVLASCIGIVNKNSLKLDADRKEIPISAFHNNSLSVYLYLIPMLAEENVNIDFFKDKDGESKAISIFERYAAGGLEILNEKLATRSLDSAFTFVSDLINVGKNLGTDIRDLNIDIY